jgi:hypothetical protein
MFPCLSVAFFMMISNYAYERPSGRNPGYDAPSNRVSDRTEATAMTVREALNPAREVRSAAAWDRLEKATELLQQRLDDAEFAVVLR